MVSSSPLFIVPSSSTITTPITVHCHRVEHARRRLRSCDPLPTTLAKHVDDRFPLPRALDHHHHHQHTVCSGSVNQKGAALRHNDCKSLGIIFDVGCVDGAVVVRGAFALLLQLQVRCCCWNCCPAAVRYSSRRRTEVGGREETRRRRGGKCKKAATVRKSSHICA